MDKWEPQCVFCNSTEMISEKLCTTIDQIRYVCVYCDNPASTENIHAIVRVLLHGHEPIILHVTSEVSYAFEKFVAAVYRINLHFKCIDATRSSMMEFYAVSRALQLIGLLGYDARIPQTIHIKQIPPPVQFPIDVDRNGSAMRTSQSSSTPCNLIDIFLDFTN